MMFLSKVEPKKRRRRQGDTDPGTKRRGLNITLRVRGALGKWPLTLMRADP